MTQNTRAALLAFTFGSALLAGGALAQDADLSETLPGTLWQLETIDGAGAVSGATLVFGEEGDSLGGSACNSYGGDITWGEGGKVTIGSVFSTMMACAEPEMAQERALFDALEATSTITTDAETLTLVGEDGHALATFTAMGGDTAEEPAMPPEVSMPAPEPMTPTAPTVEKPAPTAQ